LRRQGIRPVEAATELAQLRKDNHRQIAYMVGVLLWDIAYSGTDFARATEAWPDSLFADRISSRLFHFVGAIKSLFNSAAVDDRCPCSGTDSSSVVRI